MTLLKNRQFEYFIIGGLLLIFGIFGVSIHSLIDIENNIPSHLTILKTFSTMTIYALLQVSKIFGIIYFYKGFTYKKDSLNVSQEKTNAQEMTQKDQNQLLKKSIILMTTGVFIFLLSNFMLSAMENNFIDGIILAGVNIFFLWPLSLIFLIVGFGKFHKYFKK